MTPAQTTLAMVDKNSPGRFDSADELLGFLDAHEDFASRHIGEYPDLTPEYAAEVRAMLERAIEGATYEDLMRAPKLRCATALMKMEDYGRRSRHVDNQD